MAEIKYETLEKLPDGFEERVSIGFTNTRGSRIVNPEYKGLGPRVLKQIPEEVRT